MGFGETVGQGWPQIEELCFAFVLSALIGLEREIRQKSAGLRTYTLVGFASALIMLVSKYGFMDVLAPDRIVVDPSRVAAQIVSGIGFIGGGLIFVRGDIVKGLTTAASVWMTAAIGMACGAGLPILALVVCAGHFIVIFLFPHLSGALTTSRWSPVKLEVSYEDGRGILRDVMAVCTGFDFAIKRMQVERKHVNVDHNEDRVSAAHHAAEEKQSLEYSPEFLRPRIVTISLELVGRDSIPAMMTNLVRRIALNANHANL
jgi:putative Mg2+ transporter-C (MgtC) family protein